MTETAERSTALAVPTKKELEAAYAAILDGTPLPGAGNDPEAVSRAIAERILASETFEEAFSPQELEAWSNYVGEVVTVKDFHLNPTTFNTGDGGPAAYAVVDIELSDGSIKTVTCGGRNVLMQLVKALEKGWLVNQVVLIAKPTAEGNTALWLQAAPTPE